MNIGLRQLLLLVTTLAFAIAIFDKSNWSVWVAIGLACSAGATLVREMGWDRVLTAGGAHSRA
jgi:membrane protease YdiL (CAAX protease family)